MWQAGRTYYMPRQAGACKVDYAFSLDVETYVEAGSSTRRFRWRLKAPDSSDFRSTQTFATKREATKDGEAALDRARQKGRLRP